MLLNPENKKIHFKLVNGILISILIHETIDLEIAKKAVSHRINLYGEKDYPLLIHTNNVKRITKEARDYFASEEGCQKIKSCAIIISSEVTKVITNFFLNVNKPLIPTKIFTCEESARQWLCDYRT